MRFKKYINEAKYRKAERGGGGVPSSEHFAERLVLPQIKKAKSEKDFKKIIDDFKRAEKRGNYVYDSVKDIVNDWIKTRKKELGLNEAPIQTKGWTEESIKKFEKTIGIKAVDKGFFDACVLRMTPKEGFDKEKAEGFCASIKDSAHGSTMWRGKGKTKEQVKKDIKGE